MDILKSIFAVFLESITITGFVFVMMLLIEYVNVKTQGITQKRLLDNPWKQYLLAGLLGIFPGCLGAFTVVALFTHKMISFGALVTTMIATSGDEAFVMFTLFPKKALMLTIILFIVGILAGYLSDKAGISKMIRKNITPHAFPLHSDEDCWCFQKDKIIHFLIKPSIHRLLLIILIFILIIGFASGLFAAKAQFWLKVTFLSTLGFSFFVVISVPDHFLKKHLWDHIVVQHVPRIFFWTFGTLLAIFILKNNFDIEAWLSNNMMWVFIIAVLVGIIPESGPHLVFVTLFAQGSIPFSVLLASSISQDGHGMLPLIAESKLSFLTVKCINVFVALLIGLISYFFGG